MRAFTLVFALVSLPALACPQLSGKYASCRSTTAETEGTSDVVMTQKIVNNITHYAMTFTSDETQERLTETYITDGKKRVVKSPVDETGTILKSETISSCKGEELHVEIKAFMNDQEVGDIKIKVSKSGSTMTQVFSGNVFGETVNDTAVCK